MNNNRIIMHIDMNSYFASVEQQANPFLRGRPVGVCAYLSPGGCIIASSIEAKAKGVKTGFRVRDAKVLCPDIFLVENEPAKYRSTTEKIFNILDDYSDRIEHYSIDEAFVDLTGWADGRILKIRHPELEVRSKKYTCPRAAVAAREVRMDRHSSLSRGIRDRGGRGNPVINEKDCFAFARNDNNGFYWAKAIALIVRERIKKEVGEWMNCSIGISYTKFLAKFASDIAPKKGILVINPEK